MKGFAQFSNKILVNTIRGQALAFVLVGGALTSLPAVAQDQDEGLTLEEVIVTATRRETSLMDTGISITAYSSEKLQEFGIDDLDDLSFNTPGLSITGGERITIRGVGIDSLALGIDPAVASYVDGYYTRGVGPFVVNNFFDVDRIEVLRGPQGTLYGRNTAGGAINIISKKPGQEFEGEVNLEIGNESYSVIQGMLNIPLGDSFAWRMSVSQINRGPLQKNDAGPGIDELDDTTFDTTLRANWSDTWYTDLRVFGHKRDGRPSGRYQLNEYETDTRVFPGAVVINPTWNWDQENPAAQDPNKTSQDFANELDEVLDLAAQTAMPTHDHPEGIKGAQAVAAAIFLARNGAGKAAIQTFIVETFGYDLQRPLTQIRPEYSFEVSCQKSVPEAICCFLESPDFISAIRLAVSLGGDADTQAAIAGSIAEAFYGGVPAAIPDAALIYLDPFLLEICDRFSTQFLTDLPELN